MTTATKRYVLWNQYKAESLSNMPAATYCELLLAEQKGTMSSVIDVAPEQLDAVLNCINMECDVEMTYQELDESYHKELVLRLLTALDGVKDYLEVTDNETAQQALDLLAELLPRNYA